MSDGCLGCEGIAFRPVTLDDGRTVCTDCPDFRHECEVNTMLGWETNAERARFLAGVTEKRGKDSAERLRQDVWKKMRSA